MKLYVSTTREFIIIKTLSHIVTIDRSTLSMLSPPIEEVFSSTTRYTAQELCCKIYHSTGFYCKLYLVDLLKKFKTMCQSGATIFFRKYNIATK